MSPKARALVSIAPLAVSGLIACGGPQQSKSDPEWAHAPASRLVGTPLAHLEAKKLGFQTSWDKVRVCVETGKPRIGDAELLLETKLSYAMWLAASGEYGQEDFEQFAFVPQAKCAQTDTSFNAVVILADFAKESPGDDYRGWFNEPTIQCQRSFGSVSCGGSGTTAGWGGPAWISRQYTWSNPNRWTRLDLTKPAPTVLSPFTDWTSLKEGVTADPQLSSARKATIVGAYDALLAIEAPGFDDLTRFGELLAETNLRSKHDAGFSERMTQFSASGQSSLSGPVRLRKPMLHVLLHEVGHQFGLDHAHAPASDAVTGTTGTATNVNGKWVTDVATMSYDQLPYFYLTADDRAGAASAAQSARGELQSHR